MMCRIKLLLLLIVGAQLISCVNPFHPKLKDDPRVVVLNRTPIEVLENLEMAYRQKNIYLYKQLLSPDFRFELISSEVNQIALDLNNDGIPDSWWGYDQEIEFTDNLFNYGSSDGVYPPPDQIQLRLQIPSQEFWEKDPQVGHESWVVIPCPFSLQLQYNAISSSLTASGIARFYLRPDNNVWHIVIWRDESNL